MPEDILVCGMPKTGSTWACRLLGDALNSPVVGVRATDTELDNSWATEGKDRPGNYLIRHGHLKPDGDSLIVYRKRNFSVPAVGKIVVIIRDPRDTMVSAFYYWNEGSIKKTVTTRLPRWESFYKAWFETSVPYVLTSYEALSHNTIPELTRILNSLSIPQQDIRNVAMVCERQSFTNRRKGFESGKSPNTFAPQEHVRHMRKGVVGDWKEHFTPELNQYVCSKVGYIMMRLGYKC